ncbi:hypothetical protein Nepgr_011893 [Nepenthes gracilis]|uniref:Uncharacterized protein n=1 Tax=Nepenthes gracilis TaxID=150966 RepID=A0AAD3SGB3_NEPGR|nr:hypothetical protein Nepgr_011893 [Nepenthes gracilis]
MIASLNDDKTRLQIQVMELEESRKNFSQENQRLMDDLSVLQSQIKDLEWSLSNAQLSAEVPQDAEEGEDLNSQIEAACALVVKLIAENAELVEKVNELQIELDRQSIKSGVSSVVFPKSIVASANATIPNPVIESIEGNAISVEIVNSSDRTLVTDERIIGDCADIEYDALGQDSLQTGVSGEIMQIPLEENGAQDLGSQALTNEEKESDIVALTDAPLTGAPFRLISFIAKYVSGDDLVLKNSVYSK